MVRVALGVRRRHFVYAGLGVVLLAVGAFALVRARRAGAATGAVLRAAPRDTWLLATVDVAALHESPLVQRVLEPEAVARMVGLPGLSATCGFDPIARVRELMLAAPEAGDRGDFGVAYSGDFRGAELVTCAENVIRSRHGEPRTSARGRFTVVDDARDPKHTRLACSESGMCVIGRGPWLDAMVDAADGNAAGGLSEHQGLRDRFASDGSAPPAVVVTALLPKALRDRLKAEAAPDPSTGDAGADSSPPGDGAARAPRPAAAEAFAGVLSVDEAGLAMRTGAAGSTTEITVRMHCETAAACAEVESLVERKRLAWSRDFRARLLGLGPLLDTFEVSAQGPWLAASARAPTDDLAVLLRRLLELRR